MDNNIKVSCIDSRRTAIDSTYTGNDEKILNMIDDFFKRLEEFAKDCKDVADFETKFQASPLSNQYNSLFTKILGGEIDAKKEAKDAALYADEDIADSATHTARMHARMEAESALRNTPIVGDVMTAKQHFDFFSRFKKKKDDE